VSLHESLPEMTLVEAVSGRSFLGTNNGVVTTIKRRGYLALVLLGGFLVGGVIIELANGSFFGKPRT
jgi:hypothetical protein